MQTSSLPTKAEAWALSQAAFEQAGIVADTQMLKEAAATLVRLAPQVMPETSPQPAQPEGKPA